MVQNWPKINRHQATRFPLTVGAPTRKLPSLLDHVKPGTATGRLHKAIANDNGGQWFLAESPYSVAELERRFYWGLVGSILYKRVGGMLQGPKPYLYVQIELVKDVIDREDPISHEPIWKRVVSYEDDEKWPEYAVEVCLSELNVEIVEACNIIEVLKSGHF